MDEKTIRAIMKMLAEEKQKCLKTIKEADTDSVKQCFMSRLSGMNSSLDKIYGMAKRNGIDVSDIVW